MLTQIKIFDFQKHKRLVIDIDEPILCIVGKTDSGKSSIIRALRFALLNKTPSSYLRQGATVARVRLRIDKHSIIRRKGMSENTYLLDDQEFKAFSVDVPDDISKLANVDEVNFSSQHSPHYWLSLPAGQVSRELNSIVNLNEIDGCLTGIVSEVKQAKSAVQISEQRLNVVRNRKRELAYIRDIDKDLKEIEQVYTTWQETHQKSLRIDDILVKLGSHHKAHQNASVAASDAGNLCQKYEEMDSVRKRLEILNTLIGNVEKAEKLTRIAVPSTDTIDGQMAELKEATSKLNRLESLLTEIKRCETSYDENEQRYRSLSKKLQSESKEMICPSCGQKLPKT